VAVVALDEGRLDQFDPPQIDPLDNVRAAQS
jgi:hypothetical protein